MPDIFVASEKTESAPAKTSIIDEKPLISDHVYTDKKSSVHLFTSFCEDPEDITFENQEADEKVLLFIRKDLITNLPWITGGVVFAILPLIITPIFIFFHIPTTFIPQKFMLLFASLYYLLLVTYFFINFITWYFNIDLVTDKRVIDIDFQGLVYKNIATTKISLVQDVSYAQIGVLRTIFNYGNVLVQTAGTIDNFIFESVPRPEDAVHIVENIIGRRNE